MQPLMPKAVSLYIWRLQSSKCDRLLVNALCPVENRKHQHDCWARVWSTGNSYGVGLTREANPLSRRLLAGFYMQSLTNIPKNLLKTSRLPQTSELQSTA